MTLLSASDIMTPDMTITIAWTGVGNVSAVVQEQSELGEGSDADRMFRPTSARYCRAWVSMAAIAAPIKGNTFTARNVTYRVAQATPIHEAGMWELFAAAEVSRHG